MNPKKEFIKAIMSVLKLENNIYTIAAIEEIIDRIDIDDYILFIAYLGERKSDYERPIESISKAANEFYHQKTFPAVELLSKQIEEQVSIIDGIYSIEYNRIRSEDKKQELNYLEIGKIAKDYILSLGYSNLHGRRVRKIYDDVVVEIDTKILIENGISLEDILNKKINPKEIANNKICKINIKDKITNKSIELAKKYGEIESEDVKLIIQKEFLKNISMYK